MANLDIVTGFYSDFGRGDFPAALARCHPEVEFHEMPSVPWGGVYHGIEGIQRFLGEFVRYFGTGARIDVLQVVEGQSGDVFAHGALHVYDRTFPYLELWKFRDGKASHIEPFIDTASLLKRLQEVGKI
jgi:ketosteroid isomerase-like protein